MSPQHYSFPTVIDSTMLIAGRSCDRKFEWEFVRNMAPPGRSVHLHFGGAVAKGMEAARKSFFIKGRPMPEAEADGLNAAWDYYGNFDDTRNEFELEKSAKNWKTLLLALEGYFREWPLGQCGLTPLYGNQGIEFSFGIPISGTSHPLTGNPIVYAGRFDMLGEWNGLPTICDEKTTSSFSESWSSQWFLRNQFLGYTWAARQYNIPVQQVIVRGMAIQKREIKYLQALTMVPDFMLSRFERDLRFSINRLIASFREGHFPFNFGDACSSYSGCPYADLCKASNPPDWFHLYTERNWDPLRMDPEETSL